MKNKKIAIFIQARESSTRLPRKIYAHIPEENGDSLIMHVYKRMSEVNKDYIVALLIPDDEMDLQTWCKRNNILSFSGPASDVRSRYRMAAKHFGVDIVVRATGDNPCVDPNIARETVEGLISSQADLFSFNNLPIGIGVEAMTVSALERDLLETRKEDLEHVSMHIKHNPKVFRCVYQEHPIMKQHLGITKRMPSLRLSVDFQNDLEVIRSVFSCLGNEFSLADILQLYRRHPDIFEANQNLGLKKSQKLVS